MIWCLAIASIFGLLLHSATLSPAAALIGFFGAYIAALINQREKGEF